MMWLKGCPRCHGDLFEEPAVGPWAATRAITCLQCGHMLTAAEESALPSATAPKSRRAHVA